MTIYAEIDCDGTLTLTGREPIDVFTLTQWEKSRKSGHAKLFINKEPKFDISIANEIIKKHHKQFLEWKKQEDVQAQIKKDFGVE